MRSLIARSTTVATWLRAHWYWLPVVFGAVYLVLLLKNFSLVVDGIYRNADAVSVPYIGQLHALAPAHTGVTLGNFPWYFALWFEDLTRWLPFHRGLWEVAPYLFSLLGIAALAWSTWVAAGRWSATMTLLLCLCASGGLLSLQFGWGVHGGVWPIVCFLGAYVVALAGGLLTRRRKSMLLALGLLALLTATGVASDNLLLVAGVAPLILVGIVVPRVLGRDGVRIGRWMIALATMSVVVGLLLRKLMEHAQVHPVGGYHVLLASLGQLRANLGITLSALASLYNGKFGGAVVGLRSLLALSCALALTAAAVAVFIHVRRQMLSLFSEPVPDAIPARDAARRAHLVYWVGVVVVLGLTFCFSNLPANDETVRYIVAVGYGMVTLVFVAARDARGARLLLAVAGVSAVVVASSVALRDGNLQNSARADAGVAPEIERIAKREHADHGYGGYWDAAPLGWQMRDVNVYPVVKCLDRDGLCAFWAHRIASWYWPRPQTRTFLVLHGGYGPVMSLTAPPPGLGRPASSAQVAGRTVLFYNYDIASRIVR